MKDNSVIKPIILIITVAFFIAFVCDLTIESIGNSSYIFLILCTAVTVVVFRKELPRTAVFYTMLTGMLLKLSYVIYTPVWCRQHDVIDFGAGEGQAAYIEYILSHRALPDFDPRNVWGFFQPPLHHIISAVWMWFNIRMGVSEARVYKNVQILPLVYMCLLMFTVYLICRTLNMKKGGTLITMLIVSFHPIYILMSGSINNDALSVLLTVVAIYAAVIWYMYPTTGKIVFLGITIGLAMIAKLSSALVAPAVAILMIYKIVNDTDKFKDRPKVISYILELLAFSVVVFPIGLCWTIRNKILFDMPPGYIPDVGEAVERTGFVPRILDITTRSPFLYMKANGYEYDEYNLILATLKSSLFGEGDFAKGPSVVALFGWILLFALVMIIVLQFTGMIRIVISSEARCDKGIKIFLLATAVFFIAGYIAFAISGANLSAMDFRYAAAAVSVLSVFLGLWYDRLDATEHKKVCALILFAATAFAAVSCIFYILVGLYAAK